MPDTNKDVRTVAERLDALEHDHNQQQTDPLHGVTKDAVKEALKEWLDDQFAKVGKWTVYGIVSAGLVALLYFILLHQGWKHAP